jgi:hypothetical protein
LPASRLHAGKCGVDADRGAARHRYGDTFYWFYLQHRAAEKDFESDLAGSFRRILFGLSGDNPEVRRLLIPHGQRFFDGWINPEQLPAWLTERDIAAPLPLLHGATANETSQ